MSTPTVLPAVTSSTTPVPSTTRIPSQRGVRAPRPTWASHPSAPSKRPIRVPKSTRPTPPVPRVVEEEKHQDETSDIEPDLDDDDEVKISDEDSSDSDDDGPPDPTPEQIAQFMRQISKKSKEEKKPKYTEEQELRRAQLIAKLNCYFAHPRTNDILRTKTRIPSSQLTLNKTTLEKLEIYSLNADTAVHNAFKKRPLKMVVDFAMPKIEFALTASPYISSQVDLTGLAEAVRTDPDVDLALILMEMQFFQSYIPGGTLGSLVVALGSLGWSVHRRNQDHDQQFRFHTVWGHFAPGTDLEGRSDAEHWDFIQKDCFEREAKRQGVKAITQMAVMQRNAATAARVTQENPNAPPIPVIGASANRPLPPAVPHALPQGNRFPGNSVTLPVNLPDYPGTRLGVAGALEQAEVRLQQMPISSINIDPDRPPPKPQRLPEPHGPSGGQDERKTPPPEAHPPGVAGASTSYYGTPALSHSEERLSPPTSGPPAAPTVIETSGPNPRPSAWRARTGIVAHSGTSPTGSESGITRPHSLTLTAQTA